VADVFARQERQDVSDRGFVAARSRQRQVRLDLITVAAAASLLDDVSGLGQVRDDAVRTPLGDT
jgi:hypothetical protein